MEPTPDALAMEAARAPGPHPRRSAVLVLAAGIVFGTTGTARIVAAPDASSISVGAIRVLVGGLSMLLLVPFVGGSRRRALALWRRPVILLMGAAAAAYQPCFFGAVASAGVALGTLVAVGAAPILAGILGWAVLGHRPSPAWAAATALAITGLVLLSSNAFASSGSLLGVVLALGAAGCIAVYNVSTKPLVDAGVEPMEMTAAAVTLSGLFLLPGLLLQPLGWLATPGGIILALYLGVFTAGLANVWLARGVHGLGPGPASTLMLADPVTATLLGVVLLHEPITLTSGIGIVLVLVGLALQAAAPRRAPSRT